MKLVVDLSERKSKFGEFSKERAETLNLLGRNLYKQHKSEHALEIAKEIVKVHEKLDGPESLKTAQVLNNLGSAAYQANDKKLCTQAMYRALHILLNHHGDKSKEVLVHRGRMLTFHIPFAETTSGLSYDDYLDEL